VLRNGEVSDAERQKEMKQVNPKFTLRNYLLDEAIKQAENHDYTQVNKLLELSIDPFNEGIGEEFTRKPEEWALDICISCSS